MIVSDRELQALLESGDIVIDPMVEGALQPSSIDVCLGDELVFLTPKIVDPKKDQTKAIQQQLPDKHGRLWLKPGGFALASTRERVAVPDFLVGQLHGKSSVARLGLQLHAAGYIDAGFDGHITLELQNMNHQGIYLYPGMKIGQMSFARLTSPAMNAYGSGAHGSKYQGQVGPTPSRYFRNFEASAVTSD